MADEKSTILIDVQVEGGEAIARQQALKQSLDDVKSKLKEVKESAGTMSEEYIKLEAEAASLNQQLRSNGTVLKQMASNTSDAAGAYAALNKRAADAAQLAKDYAIAYGTADARTKEAVASAKAMSDQLKSVDASVGQTTRSVGDYGIAAQRLPGIFGEMQDKGQSIFVTLRQSWKGMENVTMSAVDAFNNQREAMAKAMQAAEQAAIAEQALKDAEAAGAVTANLTAEAEKTRAAATEAATVATNASSASIRGFGMALAATGVGAFIVALAAVGAMLPKIMEFSKALSQLQAITGATGDDLEYLRVKAQDLGAQYGKSSTEIVEAMKLVGSAKPELLENVQALSQMTESVITLSKASGQDLGETTKNLSTIMNQFGLSAIEADRAINTLAAGSKFGSVEVDYLGEAISKVGSVAESANLNIEQTTAAMELFGEKGIKAETAGNGFKRILVELQGDTENYTNGLFDLNKAIDNNQKLANDNVALAEKFGKEYFNVAQILLKNRDRFDELTKAVTGTNVAYEQAAIAADNLSGDTAKMSGAWDKLVLSIDSGNGVISRAFRGLTQSITDAIKGLTRFNESDTDKVQRMSEQRLKEFQKRLASMKESDRAREINAEIEAEKNLYKQKEASGEAYYKDSINQSKAYINALGGLRKSMSISIQEVAKTDNQSGQADKNEQKRLEKERKAQKKSAEDAEKERLAQLKKNADDALAALDNELQMKKLRWDEENAGKVKSLEEQNTDAITRITDAYNAQDAALKIKLQNQQITQEQYDEQQKLAAQQLLTDLALQEAQYEADAKQRKDDKDAFELQAAAELQQLKFQNQYDAQQAQLNAEYKLKIEAAEKLKADTLAIEEAYKIASDKIAKAKADAQLAVAGDMAGKLVAIFGKSTVAGKAAATAQVAIDTYKGAMSAWAAAQVYAPPFNTIIGAASVATTVAAGIKAAKDIWAVPVPGGGGAGGGGAAISATAAAPSSVTGSLASRNSGQTEQQSTQQAMSNALEAQPQKTVLVTNDVTVANTEKVQLKNDNAL